MNSILYPCAVTAALLFTITSFTSPANRSADQSPRSAEAVAAAVSSNPVPLAHANARGELTIDCPETSKFFCSEHGTDPSDTGYPTVDGACDDNPIITYEDEIMPTSCPADRFDHVIIRTWTVTDSCGGSASCEQKIDVIKDILFLDMHPRSCPNPVNISGGGVVPAAILGTATFDVSSIDWSTIQLWGPACDGGPISPTHHSYQDVVTPYTGGVQCGCNTFLGDGYVDLTLKFNKQELVSSLHLASYPALSNLKVTIVGQLTNGCSFIANDCIRLQ